jgi:hypothetical protein
MGLFDDVIRPFLGALAGAWRPADPEVPRRRLADLAARGRTVEFEALHGVPRTKVVLVSVGFGRELWLLADDKPVLRRRATEVLNGRLIVRGGTPMTDPRPVRALGFKVEEMFVMFRADG